MANPDEILKQLQYGLPTAIAQWSNAWITASGSFTVIKSTGGLLRTVNIESFSCPSLTIYDNSSGCSGTIISKIDAGIGPGNYLYDYTFTSGITVSAQAGNAPSIRITYK